MASVDYAWSKELGKPLTASEAHEKWLMGELRDKTLFKCIDERCNAQITCVNMEKQPYQMKVREHFKVYGEHSPECDEVKRIHEIDVTEKVGVRKEAPTIEEEITFDVIRPKNHGEIISTQGEENSGEGRGEHIVKKETSTIKESRGKRAHHIFLLPTLISRYVVAKKEKRLNNTYVKVRFSEKKEPYRYSLASLFVDISTKEYSNEEKWKSKVYFGKGRITKKSEQEYWINFDVHFQNSKKKVCCAINQTIIDNTNSVKSGVAMLKRFLEEKDVYCFLYGTLNESQKCIFVNIDSLDHFACTTDDVDDVEDIKEE